MKDNSDGLVDEITQERLKELLHYNTDTGDFTWLVSPTRSVKIGDTAGSMQTTGYISIMIKSKRHLAHRLAFLYMKGQFPVEQTDHINRIRNDNRWSNLQEATQHENQANRVNSCSFVGVHFNGGKWIARTSAHKRFRKHIGRFNTHLCACYARWAYDISLEKP